MDKSMLRQDLKSHRAELTHQQFIDLSHQIVNNCWEIINWNKIGFVHTYIPIAKNNEVNVLPLLKAARQLKPDLKIATHLVSGDEQAFWLDSNLEPDKKVIRNLQYSLILVPMLGFDKDGYRLGYGGGFYDMFLATQEHAQIIGVCYELGHLEKLPQEPHDFPLPFIATEKTIYKY